LMLSSSMALHILPLIHKNFDHIKDEECLTSLALNDSIARMIFHADHQGAIANSRQALAQFPHTPYPYYAARHLALIGRCLTLSGAFAPGEEALHRALDKSRPLYSTVENIKVNVDILHDLAMNIAMSQGNPGMSIRYLEKALKLLEDTTLQVRKAVCLMGLGNIHYASAEIGPALEYYIKAAVIFEEESTLANLAAACSNIGLCFTDQDKWKLAESHLIRSLNLRLRLGNPDEIAITYHNLAKLYEKQDIMNKAIANMALCRDHSAHSANKSVHHIALVWLAENLVKKNSIFTIN
jgi:tetratricopeptide (TPR) repeat protein